MQRAIDFLEVPRVFEIDELRRHFCLGRDLLDIARETLHEAQRVIVMDELEPVDDEVLLLADGDGRPPAFPTGIPFGRVERGADEADDDVGLGHEGIILRDKFIANKIENREQRTDMLHSHFQIN